MNRLKISLGILSLLVILCVCGLFIVRRQCDTLAERTEAIIQLVEAEDTAGALAACEELLEEWEHFHNMTGIFVDGSRLDPLRERMTELPALIAAKHPEVLSHLESLRMLTEDLFSEEIPDLAHIL